MSPGLARIIFMVAAASCVIAHGALIRSVLTGAAADSGASSSRELEIGWALLPALALAALLIGTWFALPE